jgi:hypothetical protein
MNAIAQNRKVAGTEKGISRPGGWRVIGFEVLHG